jgi:hypothetical protein
LNNNKNDDNNDKKDSRNDNNKTILANRPGILLHDKNEKTCRLLIDIAISNDLNLKEEKLKK